MLKSKKDSINWLDASSNSSPIFVGRSEELTFLQDQLADTSVESSVVKIANMPGIGKTALVHQFFRTYCVMNNVLFVKIDSKDFLSLFDHLDTHEAQLLSFSRCKELIVPQIMWYFSQIDSLDQKSEILTIVSNLETTFRSRNMFLFLDQLFGSEVLSTVPTVFFWDEAQAWFQQGQRIVMGTEEINDVRNFLRSVQGGNELVVEPFPEQLKVFQQGIFRSMTKFLAGFLKPGKRLVVVSGTNYTFLNKLEDLGSPLRGRVTELTMNRLASDEVREWLGIILPKSETVELNSYRNSLIERIVYLSGGIPRFVEYLTQPLTPFYQSQPAKLYQELKEDFDGRVGQLVNKVAQFINGYVYGRVNKLFDSFGQMKVVNLLEILCHSALNKDYLTEIELQGIINKFDWPNTNPTPEDLVEVGLFLSAGVKPDQEYLRYVTNKDGIPFGNVFWHVSPFQLDLLRRKYAEGRWLEDLKKIFTPEIKQLLSLSASVVGLAAEYYFALRLVSLASEAEVVLVRNQKSDYLLAESIYGGCPDIILEETKQIKTLPPIEHLQPEDQTFYLLPKQQSVDGLFKTANALVLYQMKFHSNRIYPSNIKNTFFSTFDQLAQNITPEMTSTPMVKIFFSATDPSKGLKELLIKNKFLICCGEGFRRLMSQELVSWLQS